jgi:hypothetical protein
LDDYRERVEIGGVSLLFATKVLVVGFDAVFVMGRFTSFVTLLRRCGSTAVWKKVKGDFRGEPPLGHFTSF